MTLFIEAVKNSLKTAEQNDDLSDVRATGLAIMLGCVEMAVSIFTLIVTHQFKFASHTMIQTLMFTVLLSDVFAGLLVTCYVMTVQAIILTLFFFGEMTNGHSFLSEVFSGITELPTVIVAVYFILFAWTVFRLYYTHRAMNFFKTDEFDDKEDLEFGY